MLERILGVEDKNKSIHEVIVESKNCQNNANQKRKRKYEINQKKRIKINKQQKQRIQQCSINNLENKWSYSPIKR